METELAVRLVEMAQRKGHELFDEWIAELRRNADPKAIASLDRIGVTDPTTPTAEEDASAPWSLDIALSGEWDAIATSKNETYTWPDKSEDRYKKFVSYRGKGGFASMHLALGYKNNGDVIGFVLGAGGGSKRGITVFFPANDFATTNEKVSMIRGGGPRGRSGFRPGEALPRGYSGFNTAVLGRRVSGKWQVQAVVAKAEDDKTMLAHTALQAKLRELA